MQRGGKADRLPRSTQTGEKPAPETALPTPAQMKERCAAGSAPLTRSRTRSRRTAEGCYSPLQTFLPATYVWCTPTFPIESRATVSTSASRIAKSASCPTAILPSRLHPLQLLHRLQRLAHRPRAPGILQSRQSQCCEFLSLPEEGQQYLHDVRNKVLARVGPGILISGPAFEGGWNGKESA